jgi:hypothetical protein
MGTKMTIQEEFIKLLLTGRAAPSLNQFLQNSISQNQIKKWQMLIQDTGCTELENALNHSLKDLSHALLFHFQDIFQNVHKEQLHLEVDSNVAKKCFESCVQFTFKLEEAIFGAYKQKRNLTLFLQWLQNSRKFLRNF